MSQMYYRVADRLAITTSAAGYLQAVNMAGANAVLTDLVVINKGGSCTFTAQLQQSNDLENWSNVGSPVTMTTTDLGYTTLGATSISGQHVRLVLTTSANTVIASAGISTAQL